MENKEIVRQTNKPKSPDKRFIIKKRTAAFSRWLHNYLSLFSFLIVLFFAVTGITLNHAEWFDDTQVEKQLSGTVPAAWVNTTDTGQVRKLEIVEHFRRAFFIKGYVSEFLIESDQCSVSFRGPGYSADAVINRQDGTFKISEFRLGLTAILNDLHKGRDTGRGWSMLIDISAIFLTIVSLSGLVMLFFLKKKRLAGLILLVAGGAVCYLVYYFCVL